jgi:hypothetical protein
MTSYFDLLPDEVLMDILFQFAQRSQSEIFFFEHCVNSLLRNSEENEIISKEAKSYCQDMSIQYQHESATRWRRRGLPTCQSVHCEDWLVLNTTCRRMRRLGKEIFFQTRCFAMTAALPGKLQQRGFSALSEADQELALTRIGDIVFVEENHNSPSGLLSLPRRLAVFSNLRSCKLLYGYRRGEGYNPVREAMAAAVDRSRRGTGLKEGQQGSKDKISELRHLLYDIGVSKDVYIDVVYHARADREWYESQVIQTAFPMLRVKAQILQANAAAAISRG